MVTTPGVSGGKAVVQPDGKIVVAGERSLSRYDLDATLDETFGTLGTVTTGPDTGFLDVAACTSTPSSFTRFCRLDAPRQR